jgi:hypothetical protein
MKRHFTVTLCATAVVGAIGLVGCGGGIEEGMPRDTTAVIPPEMLKPQMKPRKAVKPPPVPASPDSAEKK